jgi:hypothetical protein
MFGLLVAAIVVPSSPILVTLMMEALHSSEMSVLTTATRRNIAENGIFIATAVKASNLTRKYQSEEPLLLLKLNAKSTRIQTESDTAI